MPTVIRVKGCLRDVNYRPVRTPPVVKFDRVRGKLAGLDNVTMEHVIVEHTPISDQGHASTCVANALCDGCEILLGLEHGASKVVQLSRRHLYWVARVTHKATGFDLGTYLHAGAWQLQEVGVCPEEYFPYSDREEDLTVSPPLEAYTRASSNRITGHFRIVTSGTRRGDDIERSIRSNCPVAFGTEVSTSFVKHDGRGVYDQPKKEPVKGRHAMLIVGVRHSGAQRQFLLRNSWGRGWGNEGHAWVTEQFIVRRQSSDFWMLTRTQIVD